MLYGSEDDSRVFVLFCFAFGYASVEDLENTEKLTRTRFCITNTFFYFMLHLLILKVGK